MRIGCKEHFEKRIFRNLSKLNTEELGKLARNRRDITSDVKIS